MAEHYHSIGAVSSIYTGGLQIVFTYGGVVARQKGHRVFEGRRGGEDGGWGWGRGRGRGCRWRGRGVGIGGFGGGGWGKERRLGGREGMMRGWGDLGEGVACCVLAGLVCGGGGMGSPPTARGQASHGNDEGEGAGMMGGRGDDGGDGGVWGLGGVGDVRGGVLRTGGAGMRGRGDRGWGGRNDDWGAGWRGRGDGGMMKGGRAAYWRRRYAGAGGWVPVVTGMTRGGAWDDEGGRGVGIWGEGGACCVLAELVCGGGGMGVGGKERRLGGGGGDDEGGASCILAGAVCGGGGMGSRRHGNDEGGERG